MPKPSLSDPKIQAKAATARKAASQARGGLGYGSLVTAIVALAAAARGHVPTARLMAELLGGDLVKHQARLAKLTSLGFLTRPGRGIYALTDKRVDEGLLRPKDRRDVAAAISKLDAPQSQVIPASPPANIERALQQALKALAPFARYGARLKDAKPEAVPMLLRSDGLCNEDFQNAHAARVEVLRLSAPETEAKPQTEAVDFSRFIS
jgi:hypothetical protein